MSSSSNATVGDSGMPMLAWNLTLHRVLTLSIALSGTVVNLTTIVVIICHKLHQQKHFIFVLNFFVGNLLMSSLGLPLLLWLSFSSLQKIHVRCIISGYAYFSLSVNVLINLSLISINRYVQIVRFNHYEKIFSTRNTWIILVFAWLFYPIILKLPLTGTWGNFTLDVRRLFCSPENTDDGFRLFSLGLTIVITAPISFSYIGIIRAALSSSKRVNTTNGGNRGRIKNEKQFIRSILALITLSSIIHMPVIVSFEIDPRIEIISPWFHCLSYHLASSMCVVNGLTESILKQHIKSSFLSISRKILKRNRTTSGLADTEVDATS